MIKSSDDCSRPPRRVSIHSCAVWVATNYDAKVDVPGRKTLTEVLRTVISLLWNQWHQSVALLRFTSRQKSGFKVSSVVMDYVVSDNSSCCPDGLATPVSHTSQPTQWGPIVSFLSFGTPALHWTDETSTWPPQTCARQSGSVLLGIILPPSGTRATMTSERLVLWPQNKTFTFIVYILLLLELIPAVTGLHSGQGGRINTDWLLNQP